MTTRKEENLQEEQTPPCVLAKRNLILVIG